MRRQSIFLSVASFILLPQLSLAWDAHQTLMPWILEGAKPELQLFLNKTVLIPCNTENEQTSRHLKSTLQLNPAVHFLFDPQGENANPNCTEPIQMSIGNLLTSRFVDDPDRGMDQNLSDELTKIVDPTNDRTWMGGKTGLSSQGFRHMYFGGLSFSHIQIPARAIGQAPQRVQILFDEAHKYLRTGQTAWGVRLIAWSLHYLQDLAQPFHSTQIPNTAMVPWLSIFEGITGLRQETTRTISNYHLAYEEYILNRIKTGNTSPFRDCLLSPEKYISSSVDFNTLTPQELATWVAKQSVAIASEVGKAEIEFLGMQLSEKGVDFTQNPHLYDFTQLSALPQLTSARNRLNTISCQALAHASLASRLLILWALRPSE